MEIYRANSSFKAPEKACNRNVLSFEKGEKFELLEGADKSKIWWAARNIKTNAVGYVPANHLKFDERKVGKLLPDDYKARREEHLNTLKELQRQQNNAHPDVLLRDMKIDAPSSTSEDEDQASPPPNQRVPVIINFDEWRKDHTPCQSPSSERKVLLRVSPIPKPDLSSDRDPPRVSPTPTSSSDHRGLARLSPKLDHRQVPEVVGYDMWRKERPCHSPIDGAEQDPEAEGRKTNHSFPDIPEPDYQEGEGVKTNGQEPMSPTKPQGLIEPKKLQNPNVESREKQDLHRELLYNAKMGIDLLNKKSELKRELEKRREKQQQLEREEYIRSKRSSLEVQLQKQANKIKEYEENQTEQAVSEEEETNKPEFFKMHAKIRSVKNPANGSQS